MTDSKNIYHFTEDEGFKYFFISEGKTLIVKIVQYAFVGFKEGRPTYNLGFGTYDNATNNVLDADISDNGDHYKVFNTVLNTISDFLNKTPGVMIVVQGSDSAPQYAIHCRPTCKKKCIAPECKNAHRRINIYKGFIDKNFERLSQEYQFWGGHKDAVNQSIAEEYNPNDNDYKSVFFIKKQ